jgi:DNA-binding NtrC family response regulator
MAATAATFSTPARFRASNRIVLVASADSSFRERLGSVLSGLRWQVREAAGGAEAWGEAMDALPQVMIVDSWLPDLDRNEFLREFRTSFPGVDIITAGHDTALETAPGPHRKEILYALRRTQESDTAAWNAAPYLGETRKISSPSDSPTSSAETVPSIVFEVDCAATPTSELERHVVSIIDAVPLSERIPELIGNSPGMLEVSRRIRRVAPRNTPVLIEGPTGSGKELVAEALHRLSTRNRKPFVAINCAAIPESLLEAELFGHTRGAFTGAVQGRVGRIEAADGGTLFLDEIGEMPLALQAKLLRFVESGELQRVGENVTLKVDVRIIAATHQPLAQHAKDGQFRADLYYRLAVFLIRTPALAGHIEDLTLLVDRFLDTLGRAMPVKRLGDAAMQKLRAHPWPGNVRELEHVLERAAILAGDDPVLKAEDIDFGDIVN